MRTEEEVVVLFVSANPIDVDEQPESPNLDRRMHLDATEMRRSGMSKTQAERTERIESPKTNRPWLVAAAVVSVIAIAAAIAGLSGDGDPVAASEPTTTSTVIEESLVPAVQTVHAYIEAFNSRELDAMLPLVSADFVESWTSETTVDGEIVEETASWTDLQFAMNMRLDLLESCVSSDPHEVQCHISLSEDFHDGAYVNGDGVFTFLLDDTGLIVDLRDPTCCQRQAAFNTAFWSWMRAEHYETYAKIAPYANTFENLPGWQTSISDMITALEYVDEFIAQSTRYPLESQ